MKYSLVVPIYNDGELVQYFIPEFERVYKQYLGVEDIRNDAELIFVNDGSRNNSLEYLLAAADKYPFVKVIELSRNFGQHIALSAGYAKASGEYVAMMNVDMEEKPDELVKFMDCFKNTDADFVLGLRNERQGSKMDSATSKLFHVFLNKLTGYSVPLNSSTMRMMNRRFVDAYNEITEKSRYIPGLELWLGFKREHVQIEHKERTRGKSSYNFSKRLKMAFETILSFSDLPLRIITMIGISIALIGFAMILFLIIGKIFFINFRAGYTSTISVIVFLSGIQTLVIGVASLYVGKILKEVQNRPVYVIRQTKNF